MSENAVFSGNEGHQALIRIDQSAMDAIGQLKFRIMHPAGDILIIRTHNGDVLKSICHPMSETLPARCLARHTNQSDKPGDERDVNIRNINKSYTGTRSACAKSRRPGERGVTLPGTMSPPLYDLSGGRRPAPSAAPETSTAEAPHARAALTRAATVGRRPSSLGGKNCGGCTLVLREKMGDADEYDLLFPGAGFDLHELLPEQTADEIMATVMEFDEGDHADNSNSSSSNNGAGSSGYETSSLASDPAEDAEEEEVIYTVSVSAVEETGTVSSHDEAKHAVLVLEDIIGAEVDINFATVDNKNTQEITDVDLPPAGEADIPKQTTATRAQRARKRRAADDTEEEVQVPTSDARKPKEKFKADYSMTYNTLQCVLCKETVQFKQKCELHEHIVRTHVTQEETGRHKLACPFDNCSIQFYLTPSARSNSQNVKFYPSTVQKQLGQLVFHQFQQHLVAIPACIQPATCPEEGCSYSHVLPVLVYEHRRSKAHSTPGHVACEHCGAMIQSNNIQRHVNTSCPLRPGDRARRFPCDLCTREYLSKQGLVTHQRRAHGDGGNGTGGGRKEWCCHLCGREYVTENGLEEHLYVEHDINRRNRAVYDCADCTYSTLLQSRIKEHRLGHNKQHKMFQCSVCDEVFSTIYKFRHHVGTHQGPQECPHCPFRSDNKRTMSSHVRSKHTHTDRYKCEECGYSTGQSGNMWKHRRGHENKRKKEVDKMAEACVQIRVDI